MYNITFAAISIASSMIKHILLPLCVTIVGTMITVSCNKMGTVANIIQEDESAIYTNSILCFNSEEDFRAAVQAIKAGKELSGVVTKSSSNADFESLYDVFERAMSDADDYYQREGGYEEYKEKYSCLYFPEYNEDYSAFLPVSDEAVAKVLNADGKVLIAGTEVDLRDVWSYEKIMELGLGMPEYDDSDNEETKSFSDYFTLTEDRQNVNSKRKAWITLRGIEFPEAAAKIGRVDLCFRKKGILGWYNGKMTSRSYTLGQDINFDGRRVKHYHPYYVHEDYSPHHYVAAYRPINATSSNFGTHILYFECGEDEPEYSFTGLFTVNVDALLDMNNGPGFWESLSFTTPTYTYHF